MVASRLQGKKERADREHQARHELPTTKKKKTAENFHVRMTTPKAKFNWGEKRFQTRPALSGGRKTGNAQRPPPPPTPQNTHAPQNKKKTNEATGTTAKPQPPSKAGIIEDAMPRKHAKFKTRTKEKKCEESAGGEDHSLTFQPDKPKKATTGIMGVTGAAAGSVKGEGQV